jgi:hypothetical protein
MGVFFQSAVLRVANPRYGRLKICATAVAAQAASGLTRLPKLGTSWPAAADQACDGLEEAAINRAQSRRFALAGWLNLAPALELRVLEHRFVPRGDGWPTPEQRPFLFRNPG